MTSAFEMRYRFEEAEAASIRRAGECVEFEQAFPEMSFGVGMDRGEKFVRFSQRASLRRLGLLVLVVGLLAACVTRSGPTATGEGAMPRDAALQQWRAKVERAREGPREGPLTAERAVEEALQASPELEQMRQRMRAAAEQVRQVEATFYPRLVIARTSISPTRRLCPHEYHQSAALSP